VVVPSGFACSFAGQRGKPRHPNHATGLGRLAWREKTPAMAPGLLHHVTQRGFGRELSRTGTRALPDGRGSKETGTFNFFLPARRGRAWDSTCLDLWRKKSNVASSFLQ